MKQYEVAVTYDPTLGGAVEVGCDGFTVYQCGFYFFLDDIEFCFSPETDIDELSVRFLDNIRSRVYEKVAMQGKQYKESDTFHFTFTIEDEEDVNFGSIDSDSEFDSKFQDKLIDEN